MSIFQKLNQFREDQYNTVVDHKKISMDPTPKDTMSATGDVPGSAIGDVRKAGAILQRNPIGLLVSELIFPPSTAHGTLESEIKRGGFK
mgnify:CR=1 FL=1